MLHVQESRGTVDQTVGRLTKAVEAYKFGVLGMIDLKAKMVAKGVTFSPELEPVARDVETALLQAIDQACK